jgi:hypothetical protein
MPEPIKKYYKKQLHEVLEENKKKRIIISSADCSLSSDEF